jgi:hypothetical protein
METPDSQRAHRRPWLDAACAAVLIAYFLHFALPARHGGFREDEMLNMWIYWQAGPVKSLLANIKFWMQNEVTFYRPAGALYYLPLYHFFRLDPLPYRIVQISILAALIPIVYHLARLLAHSRLVAFLAVLALCYHPGLANLVFVGAFIYDVLCGFFYLAALTYYVHLREHDIRLRPLHLLIFLLLYVLALDSKEMAVTLPVIVLTYEFLKAPRWVDWEALNRWIWRYATPSLIAGVITAIYICGKLYGTGSLTQLDPYRPRYSWHQFFLANSTFIEDLFFAQNAITTGTLILLWAAVWIYGVLRRDRMVQLMAVWVIVVPLPLAFLLPIRSGGSLYLLLFGWAMIFARVVCDLAMIVSRVATTVWQWIGLDDSSEVTNHSQNGTAMRRVFLNGNSLAAVVRICVIAVLALCLAIFTEWQNCRLDTTRSMLSVGQKVSHVTGALESLKLRPAPGSSVLLDVQEQLFQNKWHPIFIASLIWNDHSLKIWIAGLTKVTAEQLKNADYVISLAESKAKLIHSPDINQHE